MQARHSSVNAIMTTAACAGCLRSHIQALDPHQPSASAPALSTSSQHQHSAHSTPVRPGPSNRPTACCQTDSSLRHTAKLHTSGTAYRPIAFSILGRASRNTRVITAWGAMLQREKTHTRHSTAQHSTAQRGMVSTPQSTAASKLHGSGTMRTPARSWAT